MQKNENPHKYKIEWVKRLPRVIKALNAGTKKAPPIVTRPNSALDLLRQCTSSMCKQSISKVQIYRNDICLNYILHTNYTMQFTVGGVDVTMSKFNNQKNISRKDMLHMFIV